MNRHKKIAIVVADDNFAIGKNNDLLYQIPEDMRYFRETTKGNIVIYGYNTLLSFPGEKPLPSRTNIVVYPDKLEKEGLLVAHSLGEIDDILDRIDDDRDAFICGGASIYAQLIDSCDEAYVTRVKASDPEATAFFPDLDSKDGFELYDEGEEIESSSGYVIRFTKYRNLKKKQP